MSKTYKDSKFAKANKTNRNSRTRDYAYDTDDSPVAYRMKTRDIAGGQSHKRSKRY